MGAEQVTDPVKVRYLDGDGNEFDPVALWGENFTITSEPPYEEDS